jgi:aldehyde dehydrogenase (NAD+)
MQTFDNYIAGEWTGGASRSANRNPSDLSDVIGEYAQASAEQARAAIAAAKRAFPAWAAGPIQERANILDRIGSEILARKEGAKLVVGGERLERKTKGYYLAPALFTDASNEMRISREEIFGPVASVIRAKDYDEALAFANDTEFGLSASVVTTSLKHASHFKRNAQAGMVMVNLPTAGVDYHVPFGGRKGSSYGPREQGRYAAEFYTVVKTAYIVP